MGPPGCGRRFKVALIFSEKENVKYAVRIRKRYGVYSAKFVAGQWNSRVGTLYLAHGGTSWAGIGNLCFLVDPHGIGYTITDPEDILEFAEEYLTPDDRRSFMDLYEKYFT